MARTLTIDLTPKIVKVTAEVELYADGRCVGTTTVDLTPDVVKGAPMTTINVLGMGGMDVQRLRDAQAQQAPATFKGM